MAKVTILPNGWRNAKLGDLFDERVDINCFDLELLSVTGANGIIPRSKIFGKDNSSEDKSKYLKVCIGDIAYNTMRMWQGVSALSAYEGIVSPAYTVIVPNEAAFAPYFAYLFKFPHTVFNFYRYSQGLVDDTRNLKYPNFARVVVQVPPLSEQRAIAEILTTADKLIAVKERHIAAKQKQKRWLIQNLLTGKMRLSGFYGKWKKTLFSELFVANAIYTDDIENIPLYSLTLENGVTKKTERYERNHLVQKENAYKIIRPNDYVYNPMNITLGAVSRHKGKTDVAVSSYYDIFATTNDDIGFFDNFLTSPFMLKQYDKVATGSVKEKQRVHFSQFIEFCLPLPALKERQAIAKVLTAADREIELLTNELVQQKQVKKYLMQKLLTGKVRVRQAH